MRSFLKMLDIYRLSSKSVLIRGTTVVPYNFLYWRQLFKFDFNFPESTAASSQSDILLEYLGRHFKLGVDFGQLDETLVDCFEVALV